MEETKTLGKLSSKLLQVMKKNNRLIFSVSEAERILDKPKQKTAVFLGKLVRRGLLNRLKAGKYLIVPLEIDKSREYLENWYLVARELARPHEYYISHYSAMVLHNMTTQPVVRVYASVPARIRSRHVSGIYFYFVYCKRKKFWGIFEKWITKQEKVIVSELERTILDCLERPDLCGGISEIAKGIWIKRKEIDYQKLVRYAEKLNVRAVVKRLGFILELYRLGNEGIINSLQRSIKNSLSYIVLDPTLSASGKHRSRWKVLINSPEEELKQVIWT